MRRNLDPQVWGGGGWAFLEHCLLAADDSSREAYIQWLHLLPDVLPCSRCRQHCAEYLRAHPPAQEKDLLAWLHDFRAAVKHRKETSGRDLPSRPGWTLWVVLLITAVGLLFFLAPNKRISCKIAQR